MTDTQENKLSMFLKVDTFLTNNAAGLVTVPLIAGEKTKLSTLIQDLTDSAGLATENTTGYAVEKAIKRANLEEIMRKVACAAAAYYVSIQNPAGFKTADYKKSELHALRDSELYTRAKRLHVFVTPIEANLTNFNSGPVDVADLATKNQAFFDVIQSPQSKRGEKSAAVIDVENYFINGDDILFVLDTYMETFESVNLNLYNQYQSARAIDNLGGGGGSGETVISTYQNSIAGGGTSAQIPIPANTGKARMTVIALGPLEFGKSLNGSTHDGNTTTMSAPASTTYLMTDFASEGEVMIVVNQNPTLAGAYKIEFLA